MEKKTKKNKTLDILLNVYIYGFIYPQTLYYMHSSPPRTHIWLILI